jgi:hypothetical protein
MKSKDWTPDFLKDFHDQKDLFKIIHLRAGDLEWCEKTVDWSLGHVYVFDRFLWFMARRGYTLQESKENVDFKDYNKDLEMLQKYKDKMFETIILENYKEKLRKILHGD